MKRGFLYGESAPERPCLAIKNPLSVSDLHATIFTAMGSTPRRRSTWRTGRSTHRRRQRQAVRELFA